MNRKYLKIVLISAIVCTTLVQLTKVASTAIEMKCLDLRIEELVLKQKAFSRNHQQVTKAHLEEKVKLLHLTKEYIEMRYEHPRISRYVKIGSTEVLVEVTKMMMYSVLRDDSQQTAIILMKEEKSGKPGSAEKK